MRSSNMRPNDPVRLQRPGHHLAIFLPSLAGGGAERVLLTLAGRFATAGVRVDLVLVHQEGEWLESVPRCINVIPLNRRKTRSAIFALAGYLRHEHPDTLLSSLYRSNIAAIIAARMSMRRIRVVIREATRADLLIAAKSRSRLRAKLDLFYLRRSYPQAAAIIAVSGGVREGLIRTHLASNVPIYVIPNPVPLPVVPQARAHSPGAPSIVACGRLSREKDYSTLLRAFTLVRKRIPAQLTILGDGPERCALQALTRELNIAADVAWPGFVADPLSYMRAASVFVHTSLFEGLPNVLLQALASGCPIVATDCPGGVREALDGGRFGTLVPVGDAIATAAAIERILNGLVSFPSATEFLHRFDPDRITAHYLSVLFPAPNAGNPRTPGEFE